MNKESESLIISDSQLDKGIYFTSCNRHVYLTGGVDKFSYKLEQYGLVTGRLFYFNNIVLF